MEIDDPPFLEKDETSLFTTLLIQYHNQIRMNHTLTYIITYLTTKAIILDTSLLRIVLYFFP